MYGAQAQTPPTTPTVEFENDVEMYGAQAIQERMCSMHSLRMM